MEGPRAGAAGDVSLHNFSARLWEQLVHFHVMRLTDSLFLWVGATPQLRNLAVAMCTRYVSAGRAGRGAGDAGGRGRAGHPEVWAGRGVAWRGCRTALRRAPGKLQAPRCARGPGQSWARGPGAFRNAPSDVLGSRGGGLGLRRRRGARGPRRVPPLPTPLLAPGSISVVGCPGASSGTSALWSHSRPGGWRLPLSFHAVCILTAPTFIYVSSADLFPELQTFVSPLGSLVDISR